MALLLDTGARISEILGITVDGTHYFTITVDDVEQEVGYLDVIRKGGRRDTVTVTTEGVTALREWLAARDVDDNRVFYDFDYQYARRRFSMLI